MQIIVGKTAGFCFGVENAVTKTLEEIDKSNEIYCLGELVHNKEVTEELTSKGVKFIDNIEEAKGKIIIRSHGVKKEIYAKARNLNLEVVDLTCPKVLHTHKIAEEYSSKGYYIFLTGQAEHPEIIGTQSFCGENYYIIENEEDVPKAIEKLKETGINKVLVLSQTTFSLDKFNKITNSISKFIDKENIEIKNTICNATKQRQEETEEISKKVDNMIIIGGKHSSNSNKLYELSKKYCKKVIFIENEDELDLNNILKTDIIGIMAGASTPQKSIEKTVEKLQKLC